MSFNRTTYDNCSYKQELQNNVSTLSYLLSPYRYEHENKCRHQLGFVGGTVVSHIQGNLVDLDRSSDPTRDNDRKRFWTMN